MFRVGGQRVFFKRPQTHDLGLEEVSRLCRFLKEAGPSSHAEEPAQPDDCRHRRPRRPCLPRCRWKSSNRRTQGATLRSLQFPSSSAAVANDLVELLFVDFDRLTDCRQLCFAGTAFTNIEKMLGGNAIGSTARGAISNQRHRSILGRFSRSSDPHFAHQVPENLGKKWGFCLTDC